MMTSPLFEPLALRPGIVAKNRIWLAPLTNKQSHPDGTLGGAELEFLARRADGGFGLVETCAAFVAQEGKAWEGELGVHDDLTIPGLRRLAARIHQAGALAAPQLFHGGLRADPAVSGRPTVSASAHEDPTVPRPRAASEGEIEGFIDAFARAAARSAEAGFDLVELHGAHGYLLSQFLSAVYNRREDLWGGSLENRARLLRRTVSAVRAAAPGLALAVRLSPEDFGNARGLDLDESLQVARWLADDGVEVLHLSLWRAGQPTRKRPDQHPTPLFREAVGTKMRIVVAGTIWTRQEAEAQLALGADAVALGRAAIVDAAWPLRALQGGDAERPPRTPAQLEASGLSPAFVDYMRSWKGFVAES